MSRLFDEEGNMMPESNFENEGPEQIPAPAKEVSVEETTEEGGAAEPAVSDGTAETEGDKPKSRRRRRTKAEMEAARSENAEENGNVEDPDENPDDTKMLDVSLAEAIFRIGLELRVPKNNRKVDEVYRKDYHYRNVEDILSALKPIREKYGVYVTFESHPELVGPYLYMTVKATARNLRGEEFSVSSSAREDLKRPGNWAAQISGSCESYAKKYCLQSLFMIDDSRLEPVTDTDAQTYSEPSAQDADNAPANPAVQLSPSPEIPERPKEKPLLSRGVGDWMSRAADAANWKGDKDEFKTKLLENYRVSDENVLILLSMIP